MLKTICHHCLGETWTRVQTPPLLCCFCSRPFLDLNDAEVRHILRQWASESESKEVDNAED